MNKSRRILTLRSDQDYKIEDVLKVGDTFYTVTERGWDLWGNQVYYVCESTIWERFVSFWGDRRWTVTYYRENRR